MELEDGEIADDRMPSWPDHHTQYSRRYQFSSRRSYRRGGKASSGGFSGRSTGRLRLPSPRQQKSVGKHGRRHLGVGGKRTVSPPANLCDDRRRRRPKRHQNPTASSPARHSLSPPAPVPPAHLGFHPESLSSIMSDEDEIEVLDPPVRLSPPVITLDDDAGGTARVLSPLSPSLPATTVDCTGGGLPIPLPPARAVPGDVPILAANGGVPGAAASEEDDGQMSDEEAFADADDDELELRLMALQSLMNQSNQSRPAPNTAACPAPVSVSIHATADEPQPAVSREDGPVSPVQSRSLSSNSHRPPSSDRLPSASSSQPRSTSSSQPLPASSSHPPPGQSERTGWLTERVLQETSHREQCRVFVEAVGRDLQRQVTFSTTGDPCSSAAAPPLPRSPPPVQPSPPLPPPSSLPLPCPVASAPPSVDDDEDVLRAELLIDMSRRCVIASLPPSSSPQQQGVPLPATTNFVISLLSDESEGEDSDSTQETAAELDRRCCQDGFLGQLDSFLLTARQRSARTELTLGSSDRVSASPGSSGTAVSVQPACLEPTAGSAVGADNSAAVDKAEAVSVSTVSPSSAGIEPGASLLRHKGPDELSAGVTARSLSAKHRLENNGRVLRARARRLSGRQRVSSAEKQVKSAVVDLLPQSRVAEYVLLKRLIAAKEHERQLRHRRKRLCAAPAKSSDSVTASTEVSTQPSMSSFHGEAPNTSGLVAASTNGSTRSSGSPLRAETAKPFNLVTASTEGSTQPSISCLRVEASKPSGSVTASTDVSTQLSMSFLRSEPAEPPGLAAASTELSTQSSGSSFCTKPVKPSELVAASTELSSQSSGPSFHSEVDNPSGLVTVSTEISTLVPPLRSEPATTLRIIGRCPGESNPETTSEHSRSIVNGISSGDNDNVSGDACVSVSPSRERQRRRNLRSKPETLKQQLSTVSDQQYCDDANVQSSTNASPLRTTLSIQRNQLQSVLRNNRVTSDTLAAEIVATVGQTGGDTLRPSSSSRIEIQVAPLSGKAASNDQRTGRDGEVRSSSALKPPAANAQNCVSVQKMKRRLLQSQLENTSSKLTALKQRLHAETVSARQLQRRVARERLAMAETQQLLRRLQQLAATAQQRLLTRRLRCRQLQRRQLMAASRRRPGFQQLQQLQRQCGLLRSALNSAGGLARGDAGTVTNGVHLAPAEVDSPSTDPAAADDADYGTVRAVRSLSCPPSPSPALYTRRWRDSVLGRRRFSPAPPATDELSIGRSASVRAVSWSRVWPLFVRLAAETPADFSRGSTRPLSSTESSGWFTPYHSALVRHSTGANWKHAPFRWLCRYHLLGRCSLTDCTDYHLQPPL